MKFLKSNFFLTISSILLSLFILEIYFSLTIPKPFKHEYFYNRYYLIDEGKIFKNINNFFKFYPNISKRSDGYFYVNEKFVRDFSYEIKTNNFGLVQNNDIKPNIPSILFLGDSLTEGLGAPAWINKFETKINNYQVINGGLRGTSATQSELLEEHISNSYNIKKVVLLYAGGFIHRDIYNFSNHALECLENHNLCIGAEYNYGFPLNMRDPLNFLNKMQKYRYEKELNEEQKITWKKIRRKIKSKIVRLHVINIPTTFIKNNFYSSKNEKIIKNFEAISNLIKKYKNNILFIRLNSYAEILNGKDYYSIYTEKHIKSLTNNHFYCDYDNNLNNFYKHDTSHPNKVGYANLYKCVNKIINNNLF